MSIFGEFTANTIASGANIIEENITFGAGDTVSSSIKILGASILKIVIPADFVGTSISFQWSSDNVTFKNYNNSASETVSSDVVADTVIGYSPIDFLGFKYIRVVSNAVEANAPTLTVLTMGFR